MLINRCAFIFPLSFFSFFHRLNMGKCFVCGVNHPIKYCPHFRWMFNDQRRATLVKSGHCLNCMSDRHKREECTSSKRCDVCSSKHHTMIHRDIVIPRSGSFERPANTAQLKETVAVAPLARGPSTSSPASTTKLRKYTSDPAPIRGGTSTGIIASLAPVVLCQLRAGTRTVDVTLLVNPRVPKSCIRYTKVEHLNYPTKFRANVPYGHFEIITRTGRVMKDWLVIVDTISVEHHPPSHSNNLPTLLQGVELKAHPEPQNFGTVDGIVGADLCRYTLYGKQKPLPEAPTIMLQDSAFGTIATGSFVNLYVDPTWVLPKNLLNAREYV